MQIRNNYDIMWKRADGLGAGTGIFNGDIGTVTDIDFQEETMTIQFDDRTAEYAFDMLSELEPAYAMTRFIKVGQRIPCGYSVAPAAGRRCS